MCGIFLSFLKIHCFFCPIITCNVVFVFLSNHLGKAKSTFLLLWVICFPRIGILLFLHRECINLNPILDASSKHTYRSFLAKKQTPPSAKEMLSAKYHHLTIDWNRVYLLSFCTTLETKVREFQIKTLNRIVFTNEKRFCFDMAESDKSAFCQTVVESIEHLIYSSKYPLILGNTSCPGCETTILLL